MGLPTIATSKPWKTIEPKYSGSMTIPKKGQTAIAGPMAAIDPALSKAQAVTNQKSNGPLFNTFYVPFVSVGRSFRVVNRFRPFTCKA